MSIVKRSNGIFPNRVSHNCVATLRLNFTMGFMWFTEAQKFCKSASEYPIWWFVIPERGCSPPVFTLHKEKDTPASEYRAHLSKHTASKPKFPRYFYPCNHSQKLQSYPKILSKPTLEYFFIWKVTYPVFLFRWEHRLKIITHEEDEINEIFCCDKQENLCF